MTPPADALVAAAVDPTDAVLPASPAFRAGDRFPAVMSLSDVAEILGVSLKRAQNLQAEGKLARFETASRIDGIRYSGAKFQEWAEGRAPAAAVESTGRRHFGGKHL